MYKMKFSYSRERDFFMQNLMSNGLKASIVIYGCLHFLTYFVQNEYLLVLLALSGLLIVILGVVHYSFLKFKIPLTLILVGMIILILTNSSILEGFYGGFLLMRNIIGLLIIIPFIGWVLNTEPYIESMLSFGYKWINTSRKFYLAILSFTQIISFFLLFGAIPMMYDFINKMVGNRHGEALENFKGTALLRSFALSTIWIVTIPSFIYTVETLDASLWKAIVQGFFISFCGILVAVLFSYFQERRYGTDLTDIITKEMKKVMDSKSPIHGNGNVRGFFLLFFTLFGTIVGMYALFSIELLIIIPIAIIIWTITYFLWKGRTGRLVTEAKTYFSKTIVNQSYQLSMMLGAGVMIYSINQTSFAHHVVSSIHFIEKQIPAMNLLYFLPFIVILLGFMGLGPLTVMVLVAGVLNNIALPYPPELMVLAITSGSVISILLSPVIMPVIVLSSSNGMSGFKNGLQFNWLFALCFYIIVQFYIQVMLIIT